MTSFPLYDSLSKDFNKKDLTVKQKEEFMRKIKDINNSGKELIYALIQFYRIENDPDIKEDIPYKGESEEVGKNKQNLTWVFTDLPIKLRYILYKFVEIHIQNIEEEEQREKLV